MATLATREPAPGALATVQGFINTYDLDSDRDDLADSDLLLEWLSEHGLLEDGDRSANADLGRALALREGLRALVLANSGRELAPEALPTLNRLARGTRLTVRFDEGPGARLEPLGSGADAALGRLLAIVYTAMAEGTWARLKGCLNDRCRWAFYDHSKNRSGRWCSMDACGNVMKARAYRRRTRAASGA